MKHDAAVSTHCSATSEPVQEVLSPTLIFATKFSPVVVGVPTRAFAGAVVSTAANAATALVAHRK